jgi:protein SCO1
MTREERLVLAGLAAILATTAAWWTLALWPVPGGGPEWLVRARAVCFGIQESGLPDAGGWVGLIGSPLGMLAVLLVGWGSAVRSGLARLARSHAGRALLGTSVVALAAGLHFAGVRVVTAPRAVTFLEEEAVVPATYPRLDREAPPLALVDQHGDLLTLDRFEGRPVLLTFAYAHCATVCPLLVRDALAAREAAADRAGTDAGAGIPAVVVVTLDPWRDTPSRLPHLARSWGLDLEAFVVSGPVPEVEAVLDAWDVPRVRDEQNGEVSHPALTFLLDDAGRIAYATTGTRGTLIELLRRLEPGE